MNIDPKDELAEEKTINSVAIKQMEKAKALVDKALLAIEKGGAPSDVIGCLKEASGLLIFRRHGRIQDGKMDDAVARALAKAKETGEPVVIAVADTGPMVIARRAAFEKEHPFNMGPEHIIFDTERGHLGSGWRIKCGDCGETTEIVDQSPRE